MDFIVNLASGFMNLFTLGGQQFMSWVTGIIPTIIMLLVLMNAIMAIAGEKTVNKLAAVCTGNPVLRYAVLPFVSAFMLGNPMALSIGKFMPEFYKPSTHRSPTTATPTTVCSPTSTPRSCSSGWALPTVSPPWAWTPRLWQCGTCWWAWRPTSSPAGPPS